MTPQNFDVFLSHNGNDKPAVRRLKQLLLTNGLTVWLDEDELQPGISWQRGLEIGIRTSKSVLVLIGQDGLGPWESQEMEGALVLAVKSGRPVIPVILPNAPDNHDELPMFLGTRTSVVLKPEITIGGITKLIWGITGSMPVNPVIFHAKSSARTVFGPEQERFLDPCVVEAYLGAGSIILDEYFTFFKLFQDPAKASETLDDLLESVDLMDQKRGLVYSISGYPGTGKSTLMTCLFLRQLERIGKQKSKANPILLNLRNYLDEESYGDEAKQKLRQEFSTDLATLLEVHQGQGKKDVMLLVDGCDEYYRHPLQPVIDQELKEGMLIMSTMGRVVKIVGVGHNESTYPLDRRSDALHWAEKKSLVELRRVAVESAKAATVMDAYCRLNPGDEKVVDRKILSEHIRVYKIPELDLFVLSLVETAIRKKWDTHQTGLGALYFNYCRDHIAKAPFENLRARIKAVAEKVFDFYVRRPEQENPEEDDLQMPHAIASSGIPHLHASVKEFLIAEHIVELIKKSTKDETHRERFIYPYGINRFVRSIVNRSEGVQARVLAAIKKIYPHVVVRERIHLAYLLGRFSNRNVSGEAQELLREYLEQHQKENISEYNWKDLETRRRLLLERTLFISLIYLEQKDIAEVYLEILLSVPFVDNLNRGFHLEYYEDAPRAPESEHMLTEDDLSIAPNRTFEMLIKKLYADIEHRRARAMTSIEVQTVCSICVNRHVEGKLSDNLRKRLEEFLMALKEVKFLGLPQVLISYLQMAEDIIRRRQISVGELFSELHALKTQERVGWNEIRKIDGRDYHRKCPKPESVSDHIWGCLLIAAAFLPSKHPDPEYNKAEIMTMLLIHDLGETFTGDIASWRKNKEHDARENEIMLKISSMSLITAFEGMAGWRQSWDNFQTKRNINALIARDIDLLENYFQLMRYYSENCVIEDSAIWCSEVERGLRTEVGKRIFGNLHHDDAPDLQWWLAR